MRLGAARRAIRQFSWAWLGVLLAACGARTSLSEASDAPNTGAGGGSTIGTAGAPGSAGQPAAGGGASVGSAGRNACGNTPRGSYPSILIDDMEDGDDAIVPIDGRNGNWFTFNDGDPNTQQSPAPGSGEPSVVFVSQDGSNGHYDAQTRFRRAGTWGEGLGLLLNSGCPYDLSEFSGLHFYARANSSARMTVSAPTIGTTASCPSRSMAPCYYYAFADDVGLESYWQSYYVRFINFGAAGSNPPPFDLHSVLGINFAVYGSSDNQFEVDYIELTP